MIAHRRSVVADLNALARMRMHRDGRLGELELTAGDRAFAAGDRVVARRNDRRAGVVNGTRAEVVDVDLERRTASLKTDSGDVRTVTSAYLHEGWLDYGYALTAHTAQGATVDRSFVLGSDELYREWGYTAMSRHRNQARFYVVSPGSVERALPGLEAESDDLAGDVHEMLSPTRSKDMALDILVESGVRRTVRALDEARDEIERTERRISDMEVERDSLGRLHRRQRTAIDRDIGQQREAIARWRERAEDLTSPQLPATDGRESASLTDVSIDELRAEALHPTVNTTAVIGARPDPFAERERWSHAAMELLAHDVGELVATAEAFAVDDLGIDL
jgi:hypothetical protein